MSAGDPVVVVGYDGSPAARAAVARAVARVGTTGRLYVVHGYRRPDDHLESPYYHDLVVAAARRAVELVEGVPAAVGGMGGVQWTGEALEGSAAKLIAQEAAARGADEIIVGTRGCGRVRALLGSVAHELIHLATCPVTVIPERAVAAQSVAAPDAGTPAIPVA